MAKAKIDAVPELDACVGDDRGGCYRTPQTIEMMKNKCMRPGEFCRVTVPNRQPERVPWYYFKSCLECHFFHYDRERKWWAGECRRLKKTEYRNHQQMQHACKHWQPDEYPLTDEDRTNMQRYHNLRQGFRVMAECEENVR